MAQYAVRLTRGAEMDLQALHSYVSDARSKEDADALLDRILEAVVTLERFPLRGDVPQELDALGMREFRQLLVSPYRLIYRTVGDLVYIVVIADGRRDMQAFLERRLLGS